MRRRSNRSSEWEEVREVKDEKVPEMTYHRYT